MMTPATTAVTFPIRTSGQKSQVAAAATLIFVSTVAVIIRVIARRKSKNRLTSSDYTVLASLVSTRALVQELRQGPGLTLASSATGSCVARQSQASFMEASACIRIRCLRRT
jgi:hypothetical protein